MRSLRSDYPGGRGPGRCSAVDGRRRSKSTDYVKIAKWVSCLLLHGVLVWEQSVLGHEESDVSMFT